MSSFAKSSDVSDEELMRRAQDDQVDAFEQLFDRHGGRALRVAASVCRDTSRAEEAVQDAFLSIWRSRDTYRPEAGSFQGWSMRIVRFRAIDITRRAAAGHRPPILDGAEVDMPDAGQRSPEDEVIARGEADALRDSLALLPDAQAEVITLAFFGELSHSEIAALLTLPPGTVKGRMRLGLAKLRTHLAASA